MPSSTKSASRGKFPHLFRVVTVLFCVDDAARRSVEFVFDIFGNTALGPPGNGANAHWPLHEFGDKSVLDVQSFGQMANQRLEEFLPSIPGGSRDNRAESRDFE